MRILVITSNYPSLQKPNYGAFVYNLMQELVHFHQITIIAPQKIHDKNKSKQVDSYGREMCAVKRPFFLSLSNKKIGFINTGAVSGYFYAKAVKKELYKLKQKPDIIYAHFLSNALPALDYAKKHDIPVVIASGESTYTSFEKKASQIKNKLIQQVNHIICVSKENQELLVKIGFNPKKISVVPNAVNYEMFKPLDKEHCKQKIKVSNKFVIGFIGHFIHRKGPNRIIEAIEKLNDSEIHLVCVGSRGELKNNNFTTIIPPVPNELLPEIYNAFDIFVLPTLHEGSCNVIEEAKACCLPIVSSKGTSVEEQIMDGETGILVDPMDIDAIADAIEEIKRNKDFRERLIHNLKDRRGENSLAERANRINKILLDLT